MKIYISGKISGLDFQVVKERFNEAALFLEDLGFETVLPTKNSDPEKSWYQIMRKDIQDLMDCDAIAMIDGWADSAGARIEYDICRKLNFKIYFLKKRDGKLTLFRNEKNLLMDAVESIMEVSVSEIMSESMHHPLPQARQIYSKIAREVLLQGWGQIGSEINRDHTTAMYAAKKANDYLFSDPKFKDSYNKVLNLLK